MSAALQTVSTANDAVNASSPIVRQTGTYMMQVDDIPWTPFVFPKTFFKILHIDRDRGSATLMLLSEKGAPTPLHKHVGAADIYVLRGSFDYEEGHAATGCFVHEGGGVVHVAETDDEVLALVTFHGPLVGLDDDGSVNGLCDCDLFIELADKNNAISHLPAKLWQ